MDAIKIGPIIPLRLQRKINRLIEIGDILDEDSTKNEENDVPEKDVCLFDTHRPQIKF